MGRTVYCRWCYQRGHNRRTCPEYTKNLKEYAEIEVENNNNKDVHDTWRQEEYAKRIKADTLLDGTPFERPKQARSETQRRCSYCAKTDHNRRTCEEFIEKKRSFVEKTKLYRELIVETLKKRGIGIGTLMSGAGTLRNNDNDGRSPMIYMVDSINWDDVTFTGAYRVEQVIHLKALDQENTNYWNRSDRLPMPPPAKVLKKHIKVFNDGTTEDWNGFERAERYWDNQHEHNNVIVMSPVDAELVENTIPKGWTDDESISNCSAVKEFFKNAQSPDFWDNKWDS